MFDAYIEKDEKKTVYIDSSEQVSNITVKTFLLDKTGKLIDTLHPIPVYQNNDIWKVIIEPLGQEGFILGIVKIDTDIMATTKSFAIRVGNPDEVMFYQDEYYEEGLEVTAALLNSKADIIDTVALTEIGEGFYYCNNIQNNNGILICVENSCGVRFTNIKYSGKTQNDDQALFVELLKNKLSEYQNKVLYLEKKLIEQEKEKKVIMSTGTITKSGEQCVHSNDANDAFNSKVVEAFKTNNVSTSINSRTTKSISVSSSTVSSPKATTKSI